MKHLWNILTRTSFDIRSVSHPLIDIHTHILPGLDDGVRSLESAVSLVRRAAAAGITHIAATPHYNAVFTPEPAIIQSRTAELRAALEAAECQVTIFSGREVSFTDRHIEECKSNTSLQYEGGKQYLLIELAENLTRGTVLEGLFYLMSAGIQPVIAHPERSALLARDPSFACELRQRGALLQLDAASLFKAHGSQAAKLSAKLLKQRLIDILSSDAHRVEHYVWYEKACGYIYKHFGAACLRSLCCDTPAQILNIHV